MTIWIQIAPGSEQPIYLQIVEQINQAIARGELHPGDKLPAVRQLASELVINPNTVARAYSVLEQQGLVASKTGSGTFVSDPRLSNAEARDIHLLQERIDNIISRGLNLGISHHNLLNLFKQRMAKFSTTGRKCDE